MQQILKRLELIKTAILIEDREIIEMQYLKLAEMPTDEGIHQILMLLSAHDYRNAILEIEAYISHFSGVVVYADKEIGALKLELKVLELQLQELSETKNEFLNKINDFNIQYNLHLGEIIRKILALKKEILYRKTILKRKIVDDAKKSFYVATVEIDDLKERLLNIKKELDGMDALSEAYDELLEEFQSLKQEYNHKSEEIKNLQAEFDDLQEKYDNDPETEAYQEASQDYEEFSDEYEKFIKEERFDLNEDQIKELKKAYRKASKLCHPDMVTDDLKEQALVLMQQLNEAYEKKDLAKVLEILTMLENGGGFEIASDAIKDKNILRAKIDELRSKIADINDEINEIKNDEIYQTIQGLDDWEDYFTGIKSQLIEERESLEYQIDSLVLEETSNSDRKENTSQPKEQNVLAQDDYWDLPF